MYHLIAKTDYIKGFATFEGAYHTACALSDAFIVCQASVPVVFAVNGMDLIRLHGSDAKRLEVINILDKAIF